MEKLALLRTRIVECLPAPDRSASGRLESARSKIFYVFGNTLNTNYDEPLVGLCAVVFYSSFSLVESAAMSRAWMMSDPKTIVI